MKRQRKYRIPLLIGIGLMLAGALLFFLNSPRRILLVVDGKPQRVQSWRVRARAILEENGVSLDTNDQVFPPLDYWMSESVPLRVTHRKQVSLMEGQSETLFDSASTLVGNILLDGGRKIYPGDVIRWNGITLSPDQAPLTQDPLLLKMVTLLPLKILLNGKLQEVTVLDTIQDVAGALNSLGIQPSPGQRVVPEPNTQLTARMLISVLDPIELTIVDRGQRFQRIAYGATVGEALADTGISLSGFDSVNPPAPSPIPADRTVTIQRQRILITLSGEALPFQTRWQPDPERLLDDTEILQAGSNGFSGSVKVDVFEGDTLQRSVLGSQKQLAVPLDAQGVYGSKTELKTIDTPQGTLQYYRAVPVYATSYSPCRSGVEGCINGTASGRKVEHGVIAVTGSWYGLLAGSSVYVPDYGVAVIGDSGRSANGSNRWIDLAYNDEEFVPWSRNTVLYFLAPPPSNFPMILP